jgi:hypothetical protein
VGSVANVGKWARREREAIPVIQVRQVLAVIRATRAIAGSVVPKV